MAQQKPHSSKTWLGKEEPRLADRYLDKGAELEQPLAIARDICKLYARISNQKNSLKIVLGPPGVFFEYILIIF